MFINFIGNALKYGRDGVSPRVHVSASKVSGLKTETAVNDETGEFWKISFRDNGIGFEPEFNERIFDVFVRLHSKDRYEGSGIGLSICKKIAAIHEGFVRAEGVPGEGATFHVYLPLRLLAQPVA